MLDYFKWFYRFWGKAKLSMFAVLLLTVVTIAVKTAYSVVIKYVFDIFEKIQPGSDTALAYKVVIAFILFVALQEMLRMSLPASRAFMNFTFAAWMRNLYYNIYTNKASRFFKKFRTGDLLTRLTDDIDGNWDRLSWYSCSGVFRPVEAVLLLGFTLGVMVFYSWKLTLFTVIPLPFLILVLAKCEDTMIRYTDLKQQSISRCNSVLEACFSGIKVIKTTLSEEDQLEKYEEALKERIAREKDFLRINQIIHFFSMFVNNSGTIIVVFIGSYFMVKGEITIGTFIMFISFLKRLIEPIWTLSFFYASSRQVFRYVDRLKETEEFGDLPPRENTVDPGPFETLELKNIRYRFDDIDEDILKGVSLTLKKGEKIAFIGKVGSGKSTLLELIAGNLEPSDGEISMNGIDVKNISYKDIMKRVEYVRQENVLFSETIRMNMELGDSFSDSEIEKGIDISMMKDEIADMPEDLGTKLGQRGVNLSGGQKQRLSIARAVIRKPDIILMDDCTAAMDATTEKLFWEKIDHYLPGLTAVIVTHRMATARKADRIIVLEGGLISEEGLHEDLIQSGGAYSQIMSVDNGKEI